MKFRQTPLEGAFVIEIETLKDQRGLFGRAFCQKEFQEHGLIDKVVQANVSFNKAKGTLRGMHFQKAPHQETKLVRCTRGALFDVVVDLRPESPTYMQWFGEQLTADNYKMLFVPRDFAHGFITLTDNTEATYLVSEFYTPGAEGGIRWNDPAVGIQWPIEVAEISEKDASWPDFGAKGEK